GLSAIFASEPEPRRFSSANRYARTRFTRVIDTSEAPSTPTAAMSNAITNSWNQSPPVTGPAPPCTAPASPTSRPGRHRPRGRGPTGGGSRGPGGGGAPKADRRDGWRRPPQGRSPRRPAPAPRPLRSRRGERTTRRWGPPRPGRSGGGPPSPPPSPTRPRAPTGLRPRPPAWFEP